MSMRFHDCYKCITLVPMCKVGCAHVGAESIWEISVSSVQFFFEPKNALKNSLLKKKSLWDFPTITNMNSKSIKNLTIIKSLKLGVVVNVFFFHYSNFLIKWIGKMQIRLNLCHLRFHYELLGFVTIKHLINHFD